MNDKKLSQYCFFKYLDQIENESHDLAHTLAVNFVERFWDAPKMQSVKKIEPFIIWPKTTPLSKKLVKREGNIVIYSHDLRKNLNFTNNFKAVNLKDLGARGLHQFSPLELVEPLSYGRGIALGDINSDGYDDLVIATSSGPMVYLNIEGKRLHTISIEQILHKTFDTIAVALQDMDNDGFLDLVFTTALGKLYLLKNRNNQFDPTTLEELPTCNGFMGMSLSIADIDRNGELDIYLGNWMFGTYRNSNCLIMQHHGKFVGKIPEHDIAGPTLTSLISNVNNDGFLDIISGNDFSTPDSFMQFKNNQLVPWDYDINEISEHTMSIDSGDIDNDGIKEIFSTDNVYFGEEKDKMCDEITDFIDRKSCNDNELIDNIIRRGSVKRCINEVAEIDKRNDCTVAIIAEIARTSRNIKLCEEIPKSYLVQRYLCTELIRSGDISSQKLYENKKITKKQNAKEPFQIAQNTLLKKVGNNKWKNIAKDLKINKTSWSWNALFGDLNNDGFLDLYIGNGIQGFAIGRRGIYPNYYFQNNQHGGFNEVGKKYGLDSKLQTPNFVYTDFNQDGNLDIVTTAVNGPTQIYFNQMTKLKSISFKLKDNVNNKFCIGCEISYVSEGKTFIQEIKGSGGFLVSRGHFLHFGLGEKDRIENIKIKWSDQVITNLTGPFVYGSSYEIERLK